jgi:cellulose synthase/poly-beta-1,6-N-acetylglucosamine synthase-like glycosyltransferase
MPAHNEALGIQATLRSLRTQLRADDCVLVIADNCQDSTAQIARQEGVEVAERQHPEHRGKGYAIEFGVRQIAGWQTSPEVLVILDADCTIQGLGALADECHRRGRTMQGAYVLTVDASASARSRVSALAFYLKNVVRQRGQRRLGGPAPLTGSGMAFPWPVAKQIDWGGGEIVEDLATGIQLIEAGRGPRYTELAWIKSPAPAHDHSVTQQRTRWEHGFLSHMLQAVPRLVGIGLRRRSWECLMAALDLSIPPLSLLAVLVVGLLGLNGLLAWSSGSATAFRWLVMVCGLVGSSLGLVWLIEGREILPLRYLRSIPGYVVAKLPLYGAFLRKRQTSWERTNRT